MTLADDARRYHEALIADEVAVARLHALRGWTLDAIARLEIGLDAHRVTIPIRNAAGEVVNLLRYAPNPEARDERRKMLALAGLCECGEQFQSGKEADAHAKMTRHRVAECPRDLFPAPEAIPADETIYLVEGEPDALTGWSLGLPCVGIPSAGGTPRPERFRGRNVVVLFDNDSSGKAGAAKWANGLSQSLRQPVRRATWPQHGDDLTEVWRREGDNFPAVLAAALDAAEHVEPFRIQSLSGRDFYRALKPRNPDDDLLGPLLRRNTRTGIAGFIGEGKTSMMLQMVAASAYGEQFLKYRGRGKDTRWLIVDLEQGESEIARRLEETGIKDRNGNVHYAHIPDGLKADVEPEHRAALEELLAQGWDGVVLDPAYAMWSSEPETERAAREMAQILDRWHRQFNFCLLVPMHTRKIPSRQLISLGDVYGWSTITRNMQVVLGIQIWEPWVSMFSVLKDRTGDIGPKGAHYKISYTHERLFHPYDGALPGQGELAA